MLSGFKFTGFEPDEHLVVKALEVLERIRDVAPPGAKVVTLFELLDGNYSCSVEVYFRRGSVHTRVNDTDPFKALRGLEQDSSEKLNKKRETRFFTRKPAVLTNKKQNTFESV